MIIHFSVIPLHSLSVQLINYAITNHPLGLVVIALGGQVNVISVPGYPRTKSE